MRRTTFRLTTAWLSHDEIKERIRSGEYVAWHESYDEPHKLTTVLGLNFRAMSLGVPSIFA